MLDGVGDLVLESGGIERKDDRAAVIGFSGKARAEIGQGGAGDFEKEIAVYAGGERGHARLAEEFVDRGDLAETFGFIGGGHGGISAQIDGFGGRGGFQAGRWYRLMAAEVRCRYGCVAADVPLTLTGAVSTMN